MLRATGSGCEEVNRTHRPSSHLIITTLSRLCGVTTMIPVASQSSPVRISDMPGCQLVTLRGHEERDHSRIVFLFASCDFRYALATLVSTGCLDKQQP